MGYGYDYLEDIIVRWQEDTVSVFVRVLSPSFYPDLELRVRSFEPSSSFKLAQIVRWFDDEKGWVPGRRVRTKPFAIPYTYYVESGRLELWARESYKRKLQSNRNVPGRSLLSLVGLHETSLVSQVRPIPNI